MIKCDKCNKEYPQKELELSHDVPKYMGGDDSDGRHWLCKKHHKEYELEVIKQCFMNLIKKFPQFQWICKYSAKFVSKIFFKGVDNGRVCDDSKATLEL